MSIHTSDNSWAKRAAEEIAPNYEFSGNPSWRTERAHVEAIILKHAPASPAESEEELIDLLVDISLTIQDRCVGHTVAYSQRFLPFLSRIEAVLAVLKARAANAKQGEGK